MKALTVWQPWASLIAVGAKQYETRSWATSYRGPIAIHAGSKKLKRVLKEMFPLGNHSYAPDYRDRQYFVSQLCKAFSVNDFDAIDLPTGAIIATAELVGCFEIQAPSTKEDGVYPFIWPFYGFERRYFREPELLFGDFTPGGYAWKLSNVRPLSEPIPAKGKHRLWEWEGTLK